jgi:glycosyltransferase involved in cell wall biosynthesis
MRVSGFTFVRNAIRYDYPVAESIRSVLPLCDEFIVAVGNSDDGTRELIRGIGDPRIRIIDTVWDDSLREGGRVLAVETDKALRAIAQESDWAFYIQADEILHESFLEPVQKTMVRFAGNPKVEGLVFDYLHFYGSFDYIADSRDWYRREVRIIRPDAAITSYRDAQGFRKRGKKLAVVPAKGTIYHYGWVKPPEMQQAKMENFHRYWHSDRWIEREVPKQTQFDYSGIDSLARFTGTHPAVMANRIATMNWQFDFDPTGSNRSPVARFLHLLEKYTGWRPGEYRNFRLIHP